jgi:hypothetical protein
MAGICAVDAIGTGRKVTEIPNAMTTGVESGNRGGPGGGRERRKHRAKRRIGATVTQGREMRERAILHPRFQQLRGCAVPPDDEQRLR